MFMFNMCKHLTLYVEYYYTIIMPREQTSNSMNKLERSYMGKNYISEKEGCTKFKCSRNTFRKIADKAGATIHVSSRTVRYDVEILDAYMDSLRTSEQTE